MFGWLHHVIHGFDLPPHFLSQIATDKNLIPSSVFSLSAFNWLIFCSIIVFRCYLLVNTFLGDICLSNFSTIFLAAKELSFKCSLPPHVSLFLSHMLILSLSLSAGILTKWFFTFTFLCIFSFPKFFFLKMLQVD